MGEDVKKDPRNYLYRFYLRFIDHFHPKMFVFENVMGITTAQTADMVKPFDDLKRIAEGMGYEVEAHEQIASDYEVLQHRHRMIIVGWLREDDNHIPTHKDSKQVQDSPGYFCRSAGAEKRRWPAV